MDTVTCLNSRMYTSRGRSREVSLRGASPPHYLFREGLHVTLFVYNTVGQIEATPVNGTEDAGFHDVRFGGELVSRVGCGSIG